MKDRASLICKTADEIEESITLEEQMRSNSDNPERKEKKKALKEKQAKREKKKDEKANEQTSSNPLASLPLGKILIIGVVVLISLLVLVGGVLAVLYLMGGWYMADNTAFSKDMVLSVVARLHTGLILKIGGFPFW